MNGAEKIRRSACTVYPTRIGAFPAATFFTNEAAFEYIRTVQADYHGVFGICVCPADSFWVHQADVLPNDERLITSTASAICNAVDSIIEEHAESMHENQI